MELLLQHLESNLDALMESLNALVEDLRLEREAIIEFNLKRIQEAYQHKHKTLLRIKSLENIRQAMIQKIKEELLEVESAPIESVLNRITNAEQAERIRDRFSCIRSMAQAAQEFNENQRQYLVRSLRSVQSSLSLLESIQGRSHLHCYNDQGYMQSGLEFQTEFNLNL